MKSSEYYYLNLREYDGTTVLENGVISSVTCVFNIGPTCLIDLRMYGSYIYIYIYVCVCVCVRERERERIVSIQLLHNILFGD